jgi:small-conductance mechanosensitive channel
VVGIVGYRLIVILISVIYRDRLGSLTVFFGIAGAGITFALQEVIVSFSGWLALLFSDIYKSGDRVLVGGWVDEDLYNGRIVRIANNFVFKEPVYNYPADFPFLWDEIKVPVRFSSNYERARVIFYEAADEVVDSYSQEAENSGIKWWRMIIELNSQ